jgi:hypothetical protein
MDFILHSLFDLAHSIFLVPSLKRCYRRVCFPFKKKKERERVSNLKINKVVCFLFWKFQTPKRREGGKQKPCKIPKTHSHTHTQKRKKKIDLHNDPIKKLGSAATKIIYPPQQSE